MSLETSLGVVLSLMVLLGTIAVIDLDRQISGGMTAISIERNAEFEDSLSVLASPERTPPSLVCLISIEGLRADRLRLAENLQAFATESVSMTVAAAQSTHTLVSVKSMLTGKYPASLVLEETLADLPVLASLDNPAAFMDATFRGVRTTLSNAMRGAGYRTVGLTDGGWVCRDTGFAEGFDRFDSECASAAEVLMRAEEWIAAHSEERTFLFLHTRLDSGQDRYDEGVRSLDERLGSLFRAIDDAQRWDDALIVVTSDHGTSLGERGIHGHGDLYLEQLLVPLVLKFPLHWRIAARSIDEPVELVDLAPTLLASVAAEPAEGIDGISLLPIVLRGVRGREFLVAQTTWNSQGARPARRSVVYPGHWQVIHDARTNEVEFYSLEENPLALIPTDAAEHGVPSFVEALLNEAGTTKALGGETARPSAPGTGREPRVK